MIEPFSALYLNTSDINHKLRIGASYKSICQALANHNSGLYEITSKPTYYIYEIIKNNKKIRGFIGCIDNTHETLQRFIPHEQANSGRVNRYVEEFEKYDYSINPILAIADECDMFQRLLRMKLTSKPLVTTIYHEEVHSVYCVDNEINNTQINRLLNANNHFVIADGHHRHALLNALRLRYRNKIFNSLVMVVQASDLQVHGFDKLVTLDKNVDIKAFFSKLTAIFNLSTVLSDANLFNIKICHDGQIMYLQPKVGVWHNPIAAVNDLNHFFVKYLSPNQIKNHEGSHLYSDQQNQFLLMVDGLKYSHIKSIVNQRGLLPVNTSYFNPKPLAGMIIYSYLVNRHDERFVQCM